MSITAFPVLVRILDDQRLLRSAVGSLAVACAAFDDAAGWLMLAAITAVARRGASSKRASLCWACGLHRRDDDGYDRCSRASHTGAGSVRRGARRLRPHSDRDAASAWATDVMGVHALFGAFFAGVVMPRAADAEKAFSGSVEPIVDSAAAAALLCVQRTAHERATDQHRSLWAQAFLILAVAVVGKGVGSALAARAMGTSWRRCGVDWRAAEHTRPRRARRAQHRPRSRNPVAGAVFDDGDDGARHDARDVACGFAHQDQDATSERRQSDAGLMNEVSGHFFNSAGQFTTSVMGTDAPDHSPPQPSICYWGQGKRFPAHHKLVPI